MNLDLENETECGVSVFPPLDLKIKYIEARRKYLLPIDIKAKYIEVRNKYIEARNKLRAEITKLENKTQKMPILPLDIIVNAYEFKKKYLPMIIKYKVEALKYKFEIRRNLDKRK